MLVHAAFWQFALEFGTPHGKEYARVRSATAEQVSDHTWLTGREGVRLWLELDDEDRERLMVATPDEHYSGPANGIQDQREKSAKQSKNAQQLAGGSNPQGKSKATPRVNVSKTNHHARKSSRKAMGTPSAIALQSQDVRNQESTLTPRCVAKLEKVRAAYIGCQQRKAITTAQIGYKSNHLDQMISGVSAYWKHAAAEILLELESHQRDRIARVLSDKIAYIKTIQSGAILENEQDLKERYEAFDKTVQRTYSLYAKISQEAMIYCAERGLPDPDPPLPISMLERGRLHPAYSVGEKEPSSTRLSTLTVADPATGGDTPASTPATTETTTCVSTVQPPSQEITNPPADSAAPSQERTKSRVDRGAPGRAARVLSHKRPAVTAMLQRSAKVIREERANPTIDPRASVPMSMNSDPDVEEQKTEDDGMQEADSDAERRLLESQARYRRAYFASLQARTGRQTNH